MSSILSLRNWGRTELNVINQDSAHLDCDLLLANVLGINRVQLISRAEEEVSTELENKFKDFILRRSKHEPIAYILGEKEFFGINFKVTSDTLIPRPETEILVEQAIEWIKKVDLKKRLTLIDVGTGSGAIILSVLNWMRLELGEASLEKVNAFAVDISQAALKVARANALRLGLQPWIEFRHGSLFEPLSEDLKILNNNSELIMANLPYIDYNEPLPVDVELFEPQTALRAENNGLGLICDLISQNIARCVKTPQEILLEIGRNQLNELKSFALNLGIKELKTFKDLQGIDRIVSISNYG